MPRWIRRLLRAAYWRWGHEGDPWQSRLVVWHLGRIRTAAPEGTAGGILIAQLNAESGRMDRVAEVIVDPDCPQPNRGPNA